MEELWEKKDSKEGSELFIGKFKTLVGVGDGFFYQSKALAFALESGYLTGGYVCFYFFVDGRAVGKEQRAKSIGQRAEGKGRRVNPERAKARWMFLI
jgi:hypothetical protein